MVDYDDLPAVIDPVRALQPGAPVLWPAAPDNVAAEMRHGDAAATEAAFARAAHRVALDLVNQRLAPVPMEPRSVLAYVDPDDGRLTMRMCSQMPTGVRSGLADAIPGLHGGEGARAGRRRRRRLRHEDRHLPRGHRASAFAALQLGRPVKWQAERVEEFLSAVHGRDQLSRAEMALDADGRVLALRVRSLANVGAYPRAPRSRSSC